MKTKFILIISAFIALFSLAARAEPARENGAALRDPDIFRKVSEPDGKKPRVHGGYALGCVEKAEALPINGYGWQVMRLSRNRNWGHPDLIDYLQKLGRRIKDETPAPGVMVGDMAQPRGGPMRFGHASHQTGLDVDIWLDFPPDRLLSRQERETRSAISHVRKDMTVRESFKKATHGQLIMKATEDSRVTRIFANAALKKRLCADFGEDDLRLRKIRPWFGHDDHIHVRLACPEGSEATCENQAPPPPGSGCRGHDLEWWFSEEARNPKPKKSSKKKRPKTLFDLPPPCRSLFLE